MGTGTHNLTGKRRAFVAEYLANGFNATRAAIAAGYAPASAHTEGSRLLRNAKVTAAIKARLDKDGITPERVKIAIAEIAFGADVADFEPFLREGSTLAELRESGVNTQLIKTLRVRHEVGGTREELVLYENVTLELHDRLAALRELARVLGLVTEKREITGDMKMRTEPDLAGLSAKTKAKVLEELGGPK